jgi:hypothetical protein
VRAAATTAGEYDCRRVRAAATTDTQTRMTAHARVLPQLRTLRRV